MNPIRATVEDRRSQKSLRVQLEELTERQEELEHDHLLLRNTLKTIARKNGISVGGPCSQCDRALLVVQDGVLSCPHCGYKGSF